MVPQPVGASREASYSPLVIAFASEFELDRALLFVLDDAQDGRRMCVVNQLGQEGGQSPTRGSEHRQRPPLKSSVFQQTPPSKRGPSTKEDLKQTLRSASQRFIASLRVPLARGQSRAAEAFFNSNSSSPMRASDTDSDLASVRMEFKRSWAWAGFTRNSSTIDERPTILMIFSGLSMS